MPVRDVFYEDGVSHGSPGCCGVPVVNSAVANRLVQAIEACRLVGARVILSGLSAEISQTLVYIGVDLRTMATVGDIQSGIEAARSTGHQSLTA